MVITFPGAMEKSLRRITQVGMATTWQFGDTHLRCPRSLMSLAVMDTCGLVVLEKGPVNLDQAPSGKFRMTQAQFSNPPQRRKGGPGGIGQTIQIL
jgi:hypothetical protein